MPTEIDSRTSWLVDVPPEEMRRIVDALHRTHRLVSAITDLDSLLETLMEESKQLAAAEASSLLLFDSDTEELFFHVALGEAGDQQALKAQLRLKLGQGIAGQCGLRRETINVADALNDSRVYRDADSLSQFETRSLLAVPMVDRGELIGVLELVNKIDGGGFTEVDRRIMEVFSSLAASVIVNARLIEENLRTVRLAAIGQAVAGISHYTKNALAGLTTSVELIDAGLTDDDKATVQTGWGVLKRSVDRVEQVVSDMLSYSKARVPLRENTDLGKLFDEVRENYAATAARKNAVLIVDTNESKSVHIDRHGVYHCLLNLVGNALDAVDDSGGRVSLSGRIRETGDLEILVTDNGPGIPVELRESIFDPFFSTKGSRGTGLGLAVSRKIIDEHGGALRVSDAEGGGACFMLRLPLDETRMKT